MINKSPVFLILCLCFILSPFVHAQYAQIYNQCLKNERDNMEDSVRNACSQDAMMLSNPGAYGDCVTKLTNSMKGSAAKKCQEEAERLHYTPEQIEASKKAKETPHALFSTPPGFKDDLGKGPSDTKKEASTPPAAEVRRPERDGPETKPEPPEPRPAPASDATAFEDTSEAEAESAQDLAACERVQSNANQCCNNPLACAGEMSAGDQSSLANLFNAGSGQGMADACRGMSQLSANYGNVNSGLSAICFGAHNSCTSTCGQLADKYSVKLSNCESCAARNIYQSALNALRTRNSSCQGLSSRSQQLATTGLSTVNNRTIADHCTQQTSPFPTSAGAGPSYQGGRGLPNTLPGAYNAADLAARANVEGPAGQAGFREGERPTSYKDFNVDASKGFKGYGSKKTDTQAPVAGMGGAAASAAGKTPVVANNTGGPIPGQGSDFKPAALGPTASRSQAPGNGNSSVTDIDRGFQGGGGYSQPTGAGNGSDGEANRPPERRIAGNDNQFEAKLDLRQFLPGGSRAAARSRGNNQINKKEENLFLLISNKMIEKCKLGILWQCQ